MAMKKHVSRRELGRRVEQGRQAMRALAAVVVERGGELRITAAVYDGLAPEARLEVHRDPLSYDIVLKAKDYERPKLAMSNAEWEKSDAEAAQARDDALRDHAAVRPGAAEPHGDDQGPLSDSRGVEP